LNVLYQSFIERIIQMDIKILGGGCANCRRLEEIARKVAADHQLQATFEDVKDYAEIMKFGVMSTPALVVDGKVVCSGRVPAESEVAAWLGAK
jgi:small redox-active disulfide protein 2